MSNTLLPPALAPSIPLVTPAAAQEKCFIHFNQCFILDPCPLKGFPQGQEFKNWPNKYKGNEHGRLAGEQAEESRAWPQRTEPTSACLCPPNPRAVGAAVPSHPHCRGPACHSRQGQMWSGSLAPHTSHSRVPWRTLPLSAFSPAVQYGGGGVRGGYQGSLTEAGSSPARKSTTCSNPCRE